jgi:hypothetical protein
VAEAGVAGAQDGLGAVGHLQLGEDGREVVGDILPLRLSRSAIWWLFSSRGSC